MSASSGLVSKDLARPVVRSRRAGIGKRGYALTALVSVMSAYDRSCCIPPCRPYTLLSWQIARAAGRSVHSTFSTQQFFQNISKVSFDGSNLAGRDGHALRQVVADFAHGNCPSLRCSDVAPGTRLPSRSSVQKAFAIQACCWAARQKISQASSLHWLHAPATIYIGLAGIPVPSLGNRYIIPH